MRALEVKNEEKFVKNVLEKVKNLKNNRQKK